MNARPHLLAIAALMLIATWDPCSASEATFTVSNGGDGAAARSGSNLQGLAKNDPIQFLTECLARYGQEVKGYRAVMQKQERIGSRLQPKEIIDVCFREK